MTNELKNVPELRFPEFDGEWEEKKIGELSQKTISGGTPRTSKLEFWNGDIPWIQSSDLSMNKLYIDSSNKSITEEAIDNSSAKIIPAKSIAIVTRVGVGKLAFVDFKYSTSQDFISLANLIFDTNFSIYSLYNKIKIISKNLQGTSIKGITKNELLNTVMLMPLDIVEQQKIGEFFSKLDRQIELEEQKLAKLEEQKKGYMQKIFSQELRFKDENGNEYPEWEEKTLEEIANYRRGSFPQPYGNKEWYDDINGEPFVQVYDVSDNMKLNNETKQKISEKAKPKSVKGFKGDIIVTLQGSIGKVAILQYDAYIDRTLLLINSFKEPVNKDYFKYILYLLFLIEKEKAPGGTIKTITKSVLSNFTIQLPLLEEQEKIGKFFKQIDNFIDKQSIKIESLKERKQGLLQKMFI
ncbi:hypothetical protein B5723_11225 [Mammaliicoccus sciuri]|uniref:restriction endonuclease subunit S n=1 Tax=Mammaliicoccus sciuri TaxID=1296 RepID=UPI0009FDC4BD|nr:restriction endonuclease subunit S [Mammaliicoccus sciuri]ORI01730.1 hypothetical protein B5723_11225 [Mammaliicoccus sciuri]